jgi:hypothetical protein
MLGRLRQFRQPNRVSDVPLAAIAVEELDGPEQDATWLVVAGHADDAVVGHPRAATKWVVIGYAKPLLDLAATSAVG